MQHGSLAIVECGKTTIDRGGEIIRLGHGFAISAERPRDRGEVALLALTA